MNLGLDCPFHRARLKSEYSIEHLVYYFTRGPCIPSIRQSETTGRRGIHVTRIELAKRFAAARRQLQPHHHEPLLAGR